MARTTEESAGDCGGACRSPGVLRLTLDLPEGAAYVPALRRSARCLLETVGVAPADVDDLELVLGELATNAVIHAESGEGFRVEVELAADIARVTVADRGVGFPSGLLAASGTLWSPHPGVPHLAGTDSETPERFGGWGLPLVHSLADRVQILPNAPHGTVVCAEKRLRRQAA